MIEELRALVEAESPSADVAACARCADVVAEVGQALLGVAPERVVSDGRPHLVWELGTAAPRVVLIGHLDTVWPLGTLRERPFKVVDGVAHGPGVFDMKAGIIQLLHAAASTRLSAGGGVAIVVTSDEEIGSRSSQGLVEDLARGAIASLVFEPSDHGALKLARKGVGMYQLEVTGRSAHAGLEPERGANATVELAHVVLAAARLSDPVHGTTVTPTVVRGGSATNVVPESAVVELDVRAENDQEFERVDRALRSITPTVPGTSVAVHGGVNRPAMPASTSAALFAAARHVATSLGQQPPDGVRVGGGSDGNFTAAIGVPTLDGLGAVGGGAHAIDEHVLVDSMAPRAALAGALIGALVRGDLPPPGGVVG